MKITEALAIVHNLAVGIENLGEQEKQALGMIRELAYSKMKEDAGQITFYTNNKT